MPQHNNDSDDEFSPEDLNLTVELYLRKCLEQETAKFRETAQKRIKEFQSEADKTRKELELFSKPVPLGKQ